MWALIFQAWLVKVWMGLQLVRRLKARVLLGWAWLEECVDSRELSRAVETGDGNLVLDYLEDVCS